MAKLGRYAAYLGGGLVCSSFLLIVLVRALKPLWSGTAPLWADVVVIQYLHGLASRPLTVLMLIFTWLGSAPGVIGVTVLAALGLYRAGHRLEAGMLVVALAAGAALEATLKQVAQRARPELLPHLVAAGGYAFPSGHSMVTVSVYGTLLAIAWKLDHRPGARALATVAAALVILGVGLSRIYLGVHWPTDVLGGYLAGAFWVAVNYRTLTLAERTKA